uniref:Uncharacterized protein n=1 Tax=Tanacetum cinerariifolium TaxID=118510 RepID=A0A6L2LWA2_TANCI|nr:hypothetical protein [Tanacetum cinerariifolium]
MMRIKTKNPPLDQTGGPREDEREKNQSQPVHQRKRHQRHLASQLKGLNLTTRLLASLHQLRNQCTLPKIWKNSHIRSLREPWIRNLAKKANSRTSFNELMDTHVEFLAFVMNRLKVDTLTPELLAAPTYELIKGSCKRASRYTFRSLHHHDLEYLRDGASSRKYTTSVTMTKAADYGHIKWIEDLKFSDDTLNDVRTALDDHLKGIQMQYLPQTIWRRSDKDRAAAMIQAIDKQLKIRRIMRSLEKFVGGRLYEGDFRLLQRTI